MKEYIKKLVYGMTRKRIVEEDLNIIRIRMCKENLQYFNLSSNAIISFLLEGETYYFRQCFERATREEFFQHAIENFFSNINKFGINEEHFKQEIPIRTEFPTEIIWTFRAYIDKKQCCNFFWKTIFNADKISYKVSFSIWEEKTYTRSIFSTFGMDDLPEELTDIAISFLWTMRSVAANYRVMNIAVGKKYSFFSAVRAKASRIIAEELKMDHMITSAEWCELEIENEGILFGLLSRSAPGSRMLDSECTCDGTLQKELLNLNVLDLICYQTDHGPNNYNVLKGEREGYRVCAFDNDNPITFAPIPFIRKPISGCSPFLKKGGTINRPYFDKRVATRIEELDYKCLENRLKPYLNVFQRKTMVHRINRIKKAVHKTSNANPNFLLNEEDWSENTVMQELNGDFGTTYLGKAIVNRNRG